MWGGRLYMQPYLQWLSKDMVIKLTKWLIGHHNQIFVSCIWSVLYIVHLVESILSTKKHQGSTTHALPHRFEATCFQSYICRKKKQPYSFLWTTSISHHNERNCDIIRQTWEVYLRHLCCCRREKRKEARIRCVCVCVKNPFNEC